MMNEIPFPSLAFKCFLYFSDFASIMADTVGKKKPFCLSSDIDEIHHHVESSKKRSAKNIFAKNLLLFVGGKMKFKSI